MMDQHCLFGEVMSTLDFVVNKTGEIASERKRQQDKLAKTTQ